MLDPIEPGHQLHFRFLLQESREFVFPCDACGRVDLDRLSERARNEYLYARAMVGREVAAPRVIPPAAVD